jgi:hypothetical protein
MRERGLIAIGLGVELICFTAIYAVGDLGHQVLIFMGLYAAACAAYWVALLRVRARSISLTALLGSTLVLRAPLLLTVPSLSDDVWRYLHDGRAQLAGSSPYAFAPSDPATAAFRGPEHARINHPDLRTVYPPAAQAAFALAARLGASIWSWKLLLLAIELTLVAILAVILRQTRRPTGWAALYAWHPLAVIETAGSGHMDAIALLPALLAVALYHQRQWFAAGAATGASIAAKFVAAAYLPFLLRRNLLRVGAGAALGAGLFYAAYAQPGTASLFGSLPVFARTWESNGSAYTLFASFVSPEQARLVSATIIAATIAWLLHKRTEPSSAMLTVTLVTLLCSPVVHPWYLLWLIALLAVNAGLNSMAERASLAWSITVVLAYTALGSYRAGADWKVADWAWWLQYVPVYALLGQALLRTVRLRFARSDIIPAQ